MENFIFVSFCLHISAIVLNSLNLAFIYSDLKKKNAVGFTLYTLIISISFAAWAGILLYG